MPDDPLSRRLTTIVALDVAGYSARTEADEARTTAEVAALRRVIEGIATAHGGRVFNTAGDGFMLEFGSSRAAVEAAFALADTCEPKVRVGVHLGDVVVQPNGDLLGHGVNVAARLMARSDPGSVLVSADVRRTIRGPLAARLVSRGSLQLDKMTETIEAFALGTAASVNVATPPTSTDQGDRSGGLRPLSTRQPQVLCARRAADQRRPAGGRHAARPQFRRSLGSARLFAGLAALLSALCRSRGERRPGGERSRAGVGSRSAERRRPVGAVLRHSPPSDGSSKPTRSSGVLRGRPA